MHRFVLPLLAFGLAAGFATVAIADDEHLTTRLTVSPAGEPRPALRYQLLPNILERHDLDALPIYFKAVLSARRPSAPKFTDQLDEWLRGNSDEPPSDEVRNYLAHHADTIEETTIAARRSRMDWDMPVVEMSPFHVRLDDAQEFRRLAWPIALKARVQIVDGDFDGAIETLKTGFALARHVAEGPTYIHGLIGLSIANMMLDQVELIMQAPDGPNLYWALTSLPRPFIDLRHESEYETHAIEFVVPAIQNIESVQLTDDEWRDLAITLARISDLPSRTRNADATPLLDLKRNLNTARQGMTAYPLAREYLKANGKTDAQIDQMTAAQAVVLYWVLSFREVRDDVFKWSNVPPWQSDDPDNAFRRHGQNPLLNPLVDLLPAVKAAQEASVTRQRRIEALRFVEALRLHAAEHDGQLPSDASELSPAPSPACDPATGKPFEYSLDGDVAVIYGPPRSGKPTTRNSIRYEIKIRPND